MRAETGTNGRFASLKADHDAALRGRSIMLGACLPAGPGKGPAA